MNVAVNVCLNAALWVCKKVYLNRGIGLWLFIFHIYLSRDAFVAIFHRSTSLRYLNALHPRPRHITQSVRWSSTAQVGHIFAQHLHISTSQSEQLNLLCSRGGITIAHIDRGIGSKALAQIAASGFKQFGARHEQRIFGATHTWNRFAFPHHLCLVQFLLLWSYRIGVNHLRLCSIGQCKGRSGQKVTFCLMHRFVVLFSECKGIGFTHKAHYTIL